MSAVVLRRFAAPAAFASAAVVAAVATPLEPEEAAALHLDDACAADPTGEGCATHLLQLRGTQRAAEQLNQTGASGFCCYASAGTDTCGSCFDDAKADAGSWCDAAHTCNGPADNGGCGGTWCTMQCVFSWSDDDDKCGTHTSAAEPGNWCAKSEGRCEDSCNGAWCVASAPAGTDDTTTGKGGKGKGGKGSSSADDGDNEEDTEGDATTDAEEPAPSEADDTSYGGITSAGGGDEEGYWGDSLLEVAGDRGASGKGKGGKRDSGANASTAARGFCCFAGDGDDKCGSCYPGARAPSGSYCASEDNCGNCGGGVWCTMHCVLAHSDPNDVCNTAYSIADSDDFCAQSEANCESQGGEGGNCRGTWCGHTTIVS